ncbi:uncharacterized protein N7496_009074 [Penicillium cataractarum]|uniref:CHAT domain-containing protein n=1 Tax=Penicillium cataractarum TaxID=2100454 RepID=A0A9W9S1I0_9EURO|nr:uncharacterized protein N7496_009074 [Penicillium cataractarum]KAJ5369314.1 hypothetical protein N7496_009074 [Penicillium cataractarum]
MGHLLSTRGERTGLIDDLNCALSVYKQGWSCRGAAPSIRIRLGWNAAKMLATRLNWKESSGLLQEAVHLLSAVSPQSLKHTDKQDILASFAGLASMAAATALNAGESACHALQLLEVGRGVIAGLLMELRGDISDLTQQHPDLADELISLREELDSPVDRSTILSSADNGLSWEAQVTRRRDADQKFSETLIKIRAKPGFHNFLLPPTADELMAAVNPDPIVVVNLSAYRCDAFLIERAQIRVLELPNLKIEEVQERVHSLKLSSPIASSDFTSLLEWLWDTVSGPILKVLGFNKPTSDGNWPRVWWIPTGILSQLPLHAAGYHTRGSTETALDRVMSSYASSVKSLIYGRRHHVRQQEGPITDHALPVAMHETPGLSQNQYLPYAKEEVDMLNDICPSLQLRPIKTVRRKDDVLRHLQGCRIFHFAGHGQSDPFQKYTLYLLHQPEL